MWEKPRIPWLRHLRDIEKHLEKNEKWFQYPERRMGEWDEQLDKWNNDFLEGIGHLESLIKELEKKMEDE
ncbi:hypothetical protein ABRT01_01925 [Lentibacillus sp. L22]|uniref:hypothetical protein n=1 Tax=Lentibacillus TaxID=175304 RepID=UPI0022B152DE|nr:hypothetical protein [Lentibacillus daqui]